MQRLRNAWLALLGRPHPDLAHLIAERNYMFGHLHKTLQERDRVVNTLERKLDTLRAQLRNSGREQVIEEVAEWLASHLYVEAAEVVREMLNDDV